MIEEMTEAASRLLPDANWFVLKERVGRRLLYGVPHMDINFVMSYLRNPASAWAERLRAPADHRFWSDLSAEEQLEEILITSLVAGYHVAFRLSSQTPSRTASTDPLPEPTPVP